MTKMRYEILDHIKALAVILMILFHFFYDLDYFKIIDLDMKSKFWSVQPDTIGALFLMAVGINLCVVHSVEIQKQKFIRRWVKLFIIAMIISFATYTIFGRERGVYFGILHNIAISSFLALAFLRRPLASLVIGLLLFIPHFLLNYRYPFYKLSERPVDHFPLLPWFGCVLIGIFLFHKNIHTLKIPDYRLKKYTTFLGRYSLEIYIGHQMILFPMTYLIHLALKL